MHDRFTPPKPIGRTARVAIWALALTAGACSVSVGFGDDDGDDDALIDRHNAVLISAHALDTLSLLAGPGQGLADDPARVNNEQRPRRALLAGTLDWIELAAPLRANALPGPNGRFASEQIMACQAGSVRVRAVFTNNVVFGEGDTVSLDARDCRFGELRFNGQIQLQVDSATGYPGISTSWQARVSLDYSEWRVDTTAPPAQQRVVSGTASLDIERAGAFDVELQFDSPSLVLDAVSGNDARPRRTLELVAMRYVEAAGGASTTIDLRLRDEALDRDDFERLRVRSVGPLTLPTSPGAYPRGRLGTVARDDSAVWAISDESSQVRLELDRNGDGIVDASQTTTWVDLRSRL